MQSFNPNQSLQRLITHGYQEFELLSGPPDLEMLLFSFFALIIVDLFGYQYFF